MNTLEQRTQYHMEKYGISRKEALWRAIRCHNAIINIHNNSVRRLQIAAKEAKECLNLN